VDGGEVVSGVPPCGGQLAAQAGDLNQQVCEIGDDLCQRNLARGAGAYLGKAGQPRADRVWIGVRRVGGVAAYQGAPPDLQRVRGRAGG
jgi:hypothetical protein